MTILVSNEPDLLILFPTFDISGHWRFRSLTRYVIYYQHFCYKERISEKDHSGWWWTRFGGSISHFHQFWLLKNDQISGHIQSEMTYLVVNNQKLHIWSLTNRSDISGHLQPEMTYLVIHLWPEISYLVIYKQKWHILWFT